jgi:ribosomal protein S6
MNCYEHTLITRQDLPEKQANILISKYKDIINNNSGKVVKIEQWGLLGNIAS